MSERAKALASRVADANRALVSTIEESTDEQWGGGCADGEWTQGFSCYHAAASIGNITDMVQAMASGAEMPAVTFEQIDQINADFHSQHAQCTKQEALDLARANSPGAAEMVAGLSDAELDREVNLAAGLPPMKVEQVVEMLLIGHPTNHRASVVNAR
jgi:hypothetical protein